MKPSSSSSPPMDNDKGILPESLADRREKRAAARKKAAERRQGSEAVKISAPRRDSSSRRSDLIERSRKARASK